MWLYRQEPIKISYHPAKFGGHRNCSSENMMISVWYVIWQDHVTKGSPWFYRYEPIKVGYHPAKFGSHKDCSSEDMILVYHMILYDHMILHDQVMPLYRQRLIKVSYHPAKFGGQMHSDIRYIIFLVCRVLLM